MRKMRGFTLVEIMIVVAIIGLLVAIGVPGFIKARNNARKNSCYNNMRVIAHAVQQYTIDNNVPSADLVGMYTTSGDGWGPIMPALATDPREPDNYIPQHLMCQAVDYAGTAADDIDSSTLDVTCPATVDNHGTYGDLQ